MLMQVRVVPEDEAEDVVTEYVTAEHIPLVGDRMLAFGSNASGSKRHGGTVTTRLFVPGDRGELGVIVYVRLDRSIHPDAGPGDNLAGPYVRVLDEGG